MGLRVAGGYEIGVRTLCTRLPIGSARLRLSVRVQGLGFGRLGLRV